MPSHESWVLEPVRHDVGWLPRHHAFVSHLGRLS